MSTPKTFICCAGPPNGPALLNGTNGYAFLGNNGDEAGLSVSNLGDVNGDSFDDFLIGAPAIQSGLNLPGSVYLVYGGSHLPSLDSLDGISDGQIQLSNLNGGGGIHGYSLQGVFANDWTGFSVSGGGDVNGDGVVDILIGATKAVTTGAANAYLVFGGVTNLTALDGNGDGTINLVNINGSNGYMFHRFGVNAGTSIDSVGDINNDGYDDITIGVPSDGFPGRGVSYTVFGGSHLSALDARVFIDGIINLEDLGLIAQADGSHGFIVMGGEFNEHVGAAVSNAGDINNDGFADVVMAGDGSFPTNAYVILGRASFVGGPQLEVVNHSSITINLTARVSDVNFVGDINGDGISDLMVGSALGNKALVIFGTNSISSSFNEFNLNGSNGFLITDSAGGNQFGASVNSAGDFNGDGYGDIIVGSPLLNAFTGASYLIYGHAGAFSATLDISTLDGTNGFKINGIDSGDRMGESVTSAGDVNGDGYDDLLIGAPLAGDPSNPAGESYIIYGNGQVDVAGTMNDESLFGSGRMYGDAGNDILRGNSGNDVLNGGVGNDTLIGNGGNDLLMGASGNDLIVGSSGNDRLYGGGGSDVLSGQLGNDVYVGGQGADIFDFRNIFTVLDPSTIVTIADFSSAEHDQIWLNAGKYTLSFNGTGDGFGYVDITLTGSLGGPAQHIKVLGVDTLSDSGLTPDILAM